MNNAEFSKVVSARVEKINTVLVNKAKEYASDTDRLHNFVVAAKLSSRNETPEQALWGMLRKHLVSVIDIINDTEKEKYPPAAMRDEKITDSINYLILLEALLIDHSPAEKEGLVVQGTCAELRYKAGEPMVK